MVFSLEIKDIIYLISIFFGLVTSAVLLIFGVRKSSSNVLIGLSYFFLSYGIFLGFLISSGYHVLLPGLYRTGNIAGLVFAPLAFLFVRQTIEERNLTKWDLLHFVPVLIYFIDFFPIIFFTSLEEKRALIQSEIENPFIFVYFNQSRFFPPNFYTTARTILVFMYWLSSARIILKFGKGFQSKGDTFGKEWILWMKFFLGSNMLLFVPFLLFSRFVDPALSFDLIHFSAALVNLMNGVIVLFFPKVLYGFNEYEFLLSASKESEEIKKDSPSPLTDEKMAEIQEKLRWAVEQEKIYLQNGLTISELSKKTEIPNYLLTVYLNRNLGTTFSDFINQKRVEECCQIIENGTYKHLTLEGLGISCGFNNRNSFISSFKKNMGLTPSEFAKSKTDVTSPKD